MITCFGKDMLFEGGGALAILGQNWSHKEDPGPQLVPGAQIEPRGGQIGPQVDPNCFPRGALVPNWDPGFPN